MPLALPAVTLPSFLNTGRSPANASALVWRGCVPTDEGVMTNDVAWLPDGGFVVTSFMPAIDGLGFGALWSLLEIRFGGETGEVLRTAL